MYLCMVCVCVLYPAGLVAVMTLMLISLLVSVQTRAGAVSCLEGSLILLLWVVLLVHMMPRIIIIISSIRVDSLLHLSASLPMDSAVAAPAMSGVSCGTVSSDKSSILSSSDMVSAVLHCRKPALLDPRNLERQVVVTVKGSGAG